MKEIAQHILDLVENSARAGARRIMIDLQQDSSEDILCLSVCDDGRGMSLRAVQQATDPFFTSRRSRRVGLGLPLLAASTSRCGGGLRIDSLEGRGTKVVAAFKLSHIDTPPLGDLESTLICAIMGHTDIDVTYTHRCDGRRFEFDSGTVKNELGDLPLGHPLVIGWMERVLSRGLATVGGSVTPQEDGR